MRISGAESLIMEALWANHPTTAEDIFARVAPGRGWSETTVKTLLARLVGKKAVDTEREGRRYLYRPLLAREAYVESESREFIDRMFGGRVAPLVSHFSAREKLSPEDIAELKRLLAEIDDGQ
ncbi:MAG: BlaI/MecI/CopY family transcriptional regulator [Caulobacterales bacterium 68-7]|nr:BlaI/MecI/CopY family transcriptional regulator [Caulobacterales bacterium]OJU08778.1 MAG: BlaI/MecI/CopY family transcriptional regulator [Caulobacterales bacterium 68-7]